VENNEGWSLSGGYRGQEKPNKSKKTDSRGQKHITNKKYIPSEWFSEDGIKSKEYPIEKAVNFKHTGDTSVFYAPHILLKANIGKNHSIPIQFLPNEDLRFREKVIGVAAPKEDVEKLENIYKFIKKHNQLLRAFLCSTSPECVVNMNTMVQLRDLKELPYLIGKDKYQVFYEDNPVINDVADYYQKFIRQPESSEILQPIPNSKLPKRIQQYSDILCKTLNKLHQKDNLRFRLSEVATFHYNKFIRTTFYYDDLPALAMPKTFPEIAGNQLEKLLTLDKGHTRFKRILKIYQKDCVHFIKPNELRYKKKNYCIIC